MGVPPNNPVVMDDRMTTRLEAYGDLGLPHFKNPNIRILVGGLEHFLFFHMLGIMIPIDFHIFQRG